MTVERFPIEEGHIASFARALGDTDPVRFGPAAVAPPTFVIASAQWDPDYPLRPRPGVAWMGSGREPTGRSSDVGDSGGTVLHAEQHYEYARPLRVGDVLSAVELPGKTWEKQGRRSGKLVFEEFVTQYRDQLGELVVTARLVGVRTEKPVENA